MHLPASLNASSKQSLIAYKRLFPAAIRLVLLLTCLSLCACVQQRSWQLGPPLSRSDAMDPAQGLHLAQVMQRLGPPLRMSATPNGFVMAWEHWIIRERRVGFGLAAVGADFLSVDWGRADTAGDFLVMTFDHRHRLLTSHLQQWDRKAGSGSGVQAFVSAMDVVDVADLRQPLPAHHWGFNSLLNLPTALNRANRLDTGEAGVEKRGTGSSVGQHSLEH